MTIKGEWARYAVGSPSTRPNWTNIDCCPFETVFHVCHVRDAYRIFEDGRIRSSLVWDESRLRNTRACVSWVSPNTWAPGSIYGNIRFEFEWRELVREKRFFWVEGINYYSPPAYRVLVTDKESPFANSQRFDPKRKSRPVHYDSNTDTWHWNGEFTAEFLIDNDLNLDICKRVSFVKHHDNICKRNQCEHSGADGKLAGAQLLAMLLGNRVTNARNLFLDAEGKKKALHGDAIAGFEYLIRQVLRHPGRTGFVKASDATAPYLATAIFARAGRGGKAGLKKLCGLFVNERELRVALGDRIRRHFELKSIAELASTDLS